MFAVYYWHPSDRYNETVAYLDTREVAEELAKILYMNGYEVDINYRKCWPQQ